MITNYTTRTRVLLQAAHLCQLPSSDFLQRARTQVLVRCGVPSLAACQVRKKGAPVEKKRQSVRTGTRTQNLLLRRQAPYPLGHTDVHGTVGSSRTCTRHSSLGVEHSLSKRKVVGSNPACGFQLLFSHLFWGGWGEETQLLECYERDSRLIINQPVLLSISSTCARGYRGKAMTCSTASLHDNAFLGSGADFH